MKLLRGLGFGMKPPMYLNPGDKMELGVEGLGVQSSRAVEMSVE